MANQIVWKQGAAGLALLAVASFAAAAGEVDLLLPDDDPRVVKNVDPAAYRNLEGIWWCRFLKSKGDIERNYISIWTFEAAKKRVHVVWSPVHKGAMYDYVWNGKQLILNVGTYKTQLQVGPALVIEDSQLRWKGWYCSPQQAVIWPPDALQFLDYSRYPWLAGLVEDGPSIMKYRDPKQYEEWRQGLPR